jgi:hypothetical protein
VKYCAQTTIIASYEYITPPAPAAVALKGAASIKSVH